MRIPLMLVTFENAKDISMRFRGITTRIVRFFPKLRIDLDRNDMNIDAEVYVGACLISSALWGFLVLALILTLLVILGGNIQQALLMSLAGGALVSLVFFVILMTYPTILSGKRAELINRELVYALKNMLLEVSAGASLYEAITVVSRSDYGLVSEEFGRVVRRVNTGVPMDDAFEELALKTSSEYLRSSIWQLLNAIKAGTNIVGTLRELVKELTANQRTKIRNYAQELNIMALLYLLFSVVLPTIATTMIIIVGPFLGVDAGPGVFYIFLPIAFFIQIVLLEFIKSRRPVVSL